MSEELAALIQRNGPRAGRRHELEAGAWVIGRTDEADIVFDHPDISRQHARIFVDAAGAELSDLGSKNGTTVDGRAIGMNHRQRLAHGSKICLGALELELLHPGARIDRLLADNGEVTITRPAVAKELATQHVRSVAVPLIVAAVFAVLLAVLLWRG